MRKPRFTIGGLMAVIAIIAVDSAALARPSMLLSQALFFLTYALFGTAALGAVFCRGDDRAWWIGFLTFGAGYLVFIADSNNWIFKPLIWNPIPILLCSTVLEWVGTHDLDKRFLVANQRFTMVGHLICAQAMAAIGGALAWRFHATAIDKSSAAPSVQASTAPRRWSRTSMALMLALTISLLGGLVAIAEAGRMQLAAGGFFLWTCGALGCAVLGALFGRGKRREIRAGIALFGLGYLYTTLLKPIVDPSDFELPRPRYVTDQLLESLRPLVPFRWRSGDPSARIWEALEKPISMHFPEGETLENLLKYVKMATSTSDFPEGIPIYVDPIGLQEAERTFGDTMTIDLQGVPLATTLRLALRQIQMEHVVRDGFLLITSEDSLGRPERYDPFLIVGHCVLALLAAAVGGSIAPWIAAQSGRGTATAPAAKS